ncbi:hypothetical protein V7183_24150 [Bacillus sp. JJ1127]|uniref:hypothetical protein n=1 Tax=Bacillus sp. JJ1127 TaxID=3122952 RepID=UPI002FFE7477
MQIKPGEVFVTNCKYEYDDGEYETESIKGLALDETYFVTADEEGFYIYETKCLIESEELGDCVVQLGVLGGNRIELAALPNMNVMDFLFKLIEK